MDEKVFFEKSAANQKRSVSAYINSLKKIEKATGQSMTRQIAIQKAGYKKIELAAKMAGTKIGPSINSRIAVAERGLVRLGLIGSKALTSLMAKATMVGKVFNNVTRKVVHGIFQIHIGRDFCIDNPHLFFFQRHVSSC